MNLNQKQIKKRLSMILSLLLIISSVNISSAAKTRFADVPDTHWASKVIAKWSGEDYDVLQGDGKGNFNPSKGLTLGEIMTVISKTFGYVQKQEAQVTPAWAKESVEKAIAAGILPKTEKIDANKMITRQEAIKYIAEAFGIQSSQGNTPFIDDQDIDEQYKGYVKAFYDMGYINGDNKDKSKAKFNPKANYTRAEAMQVIDNILSDIIDRYTMDKTYEKNIIIRKAGVNLHNIKAKQNIIIAQGAQDSNILIDKVQIGKSLIIYGGKDITVVSDKMIENTIINKPYKSVTLRGKFGIVTVHDKTTVHIIGKVGKVILLGSAKATLNGEEIVQTKDDKNQTPSKSTKPITKTPGGGGAGGGGTTGGGNTGTIGDNPSITVTTKFPTGTVEDNRIDVEYTAKPSKGAEITEVSYTINDSTFNYIYLKGGGIIEPKGTLGKGRVLLVPNENIIVFKVVDSSGKSATFTVKEKPNYQWATLAPRIDPKDIEYIEGNSGKRYVTNRIIIYTRDNVSKKDLDEAVKSVNGKIIGKIAIVDKYTLEVPKNNAKGLEQLCSYLMEKYPSVIEAAYLDKIEKVGHDTVDAEVKTTNDPWWENQQWALDAINVPKAWEYMKDNSINLTEASNKIKVGIIDDGVINEHEDLRIPIENIINENIDIHDHGTHVMGTIAAIHDNSTGIAGVINISRKHLYSYDCFLYRDAQGDVSTRYGDILEGLTWNVVNGVRVINASLGAEGDREPNPEFDRNMDKLTKNGYDFVVVHSAGNSNINARLNGVFALVTQDNLRRRIITVGASDIEGNMANFSNHGDRVDVVAPGVSIYSSTIGGYVNKNGTSMAAPHVAGVAAMVWAANPALSGQQVKDIIVRSANNRGRIITDVRHNENPTLFPRAEYREINALAAVQLAREEEPENKIGRLVGIVIRAQHGNDNSLNNPISNAKIILYEKSTDPKKQKGKRIKSVKSDNDGYYRMNNIEAGDYVFTVEAEGYEIETVNVKIEDGVTTNVHKLKLVTKSNKKGKSTGKITNATTGLPVSEAITLEFRRGIDPDLTESAEVIKSENGRYSIELPAGNYTVTAKADGYITSTGYAVSYGDDITNENQDIVISPNMIQGESFLRFVLTWGDRPYDLDSHLTGFAQNQRIHTYYGNKIEYYNSDKFSTLDVDDIDSFGPETITINNLVEGRYNYYVHDYTNRGITSSPQLGLSGAMVHVYDSYGKNLKTFNVPVDQNGTVWHVFSVEVKGNEYVIFPVNNISDKYMLSVDNQNGGTRLRTIDTSEDEDSINIILPQKDSKIQSRKQSSIDSDNSDLEVKKDDSDKQGTNQSTTNN